MSMENLQLDDFTRYKFLSGIEHSPDGGATPALSPIKPIWKTTTIILIFGFIMSKQNSIFN